MRNVRNLYLVTDALDVSALIHRDDSIYIYFDSNAFICSDSLIGQKFHYSDFLSKSDHNEIDTMFRSYLSSFVSRYIDLNPNDFAFQLSFLVFPVFFWERALANIFKEINPSFIFVSNKCLTEEVLCLGSDLFGDSRKSFSEWSLRYCIDCVFKETSRHKEYYKYDDSSRSEPVLVPKAQRIIAFCEKTINKLVSSIGSSSSVMSFLCVYTSAVLFREEFRPILVSVQPGKVRRLRQLLWKQGRRIHNISPDELFRIISSEYGGAPASFSFSHHINNADVHPTALASLWFGALIKYYRQYIEPGIYDFMQAYRGEFITDASHHPIVHAISREIKRNKGWHISVLPEGGVNAYEQPKTERDLLLIEPHQNLTQYVSSRDVYNTILNMRPCHPDIRILGYDTTLPGSKIIGLAIRILLQSYFRFFKCSRAQKIIFLEPAYVDSADFGISRPSLISYAHMAKESDSLVQNVNFQDFIVIGNCRNKAHFCSLRLPHLIHSRLHWSFLASAADVLITRDSSLALESLVNLKIPVLIWNNSNISFSNYKRVANRVGSSPVFSYVTNESHLQSCLSKLLDLSSTSDSSYYKTFNYFLSSYQEHSIKIE